LPPPFAEEINFLWMGVFLFDIMKLLFFSHTPLDNNEGGFL